MNTSPLRFVVLRHEGIPDPHFDLMFETSPGSALATWRSPVWPPADVPSGLVNLPDHRRDYLEYEGPVSHNRGSVHRVAAGTHNVRQNDADVLIAVLSTGQYLTLPKGKQSAEQSAGA